MRMEDTMRIEVKGGERDDTIEFPGVTFFLGNVSVLSRPARGLWVEAGKTYTIWEIDNKEFDTVPDRVVVQSEGVSFPGSLLIVVLPSGKKLETELVGGTQRYGFFIDPKDFKSASSLVPLVVGGTIVGAVLAFLRRR